MSDWVIAPSTGGVEIEDNNLPPPVIEAHLCDNEEMSEVSVPSRAVSIATTVPEDATNIELSATPPLRSFKDMNEDMFEEGYDIDGEIGPLSINALKDFQRSNNAGVDGILGPETCYKLLNKSTLVKKENNIVELINIENVDSFSQEINDAQILLKQLGLYTSSIDGINGPGTKRAVKEFQSKAGLSPDGVIGPQTLAALSKGENAYTTENIVADSKADTAAAATGTRRSTLQPAASDASQGCCQFPP